MTEAIAVSALRKSYGKTVALDGLDLSVAEGEVHGFLGPNGAGKTTTIRVLLGLLHERVLEPPTLEELFLRHYAAGGLAVEGAPV